MQRIITLLIAAFLLSSAFGQTGIKNFQNVNISNKSLDKLIPTDIRYGDELSRKLSPLLNIYLSGLEKNPGTMLQTEGSVPGLKGLLSFQEDPIDGLILPVFIKSNNVSASASLIKAYGGKIRATAGDIFTAEIPADKLKIIAQSPDIIYVDASSISETKIDISRTETKVNQIHSGTGLPRSYKGNGVIVGVVDSGIDWKHPDFSTPGSNRIRYLWDMSGTGNPPAGTDYGTEYTKTQLDALQCLEQDLDDGGGHGTHVAGTAAGNGGANLNYTGMAPESDIIFVKGFRTGPSFSDADVFNGCYYIFLKAQELGKPAVINLSLGGHYGPHDGSSNYEQGLSNLTGNGKIIVAAAGNEGDTPIHLGYTASGTTTEQASETFLELYDGSFFGADMWYNNGDIKVGIAAYDTTTFNLIGYTTPIEPGQKTEDLAFTVNNYTYAYVTIDATGINNPNNGANEVVVVMDSKNGQADMLAAYWTLYTYGSGSFDAWAITGGHFATYSNNYIKGGDNLKTIGTPGTGKKIICVGSYTTKDRWVNVDGSTYLQPGDPVIGRVSSFSSVGPSRDGRTKPDIVAPGEVIIAAYSSSLTQTPRPLILQGGMHQKMHGTSMASPHVTGVVALLLEKKPDLTYEEALTALKNTAVKDGFTGATPNNFYGSGKIDAYTAFQSISGGGGGVQTADLAYDDGEPSSGYVWNTAGQGSAVRMTPTLSNAKLTKMEIYITGINSGTATYRPVVLGNSAGQPGTHLVNLSSKTAATYPGWDPTDLSSYNITVNGDFFVGLLYDGINTPGYGYDPVDNGRAWDYSGSAWSQWNETYFIRATIQTIVTEVEMENEIPAEFSLSQNYPNPFNPVSSFKLSLPEGRYTKIIVYDIQGRKVAELINNYLNAGTYNVTWNGKNDEGISAASGTYLYTVQAGEFFQTKKMMLLK
jgi:minor extracellular serine protease Vpr